MISNPLKTSKLERNKLETQNEGMKNIIEFIKEDRLEEAIDQLLDIAINMEEIYGELLLLRARLSNISKRNLDGLITDPQALVQKNKVGKALVNLVFEVKKLTNDIELDSITESIKVPKIPYQSFRNKFREVIAPYHILNSNRYLNLVFGNISNIENINIVVGCSQDFDLTQSHPRSALGSLWRLKMNDNPMLQEIDDNWTKSRRPKSAGLGTSEYVKLSENSNNLEGIIFTVTTRDISQDNLDKGLYTNTPVEGVPLVLRQVFEKSKEKEIKSLALPLLGAGFANISRTHNNPELRFAIEKTILALTIDESLNYLINPKSYLDRVIIVIYSNDPQSDREHELWELSIKMLTLESEKRRKIIRELIYNI
jgi:hypothetical protein